MTSFSPSYLLHILLALFDYEDVPRIIFRFPYTSENAYPCFPSPRNEVLSESVLLDSLLMCSYMLSSDKQGTKLQVSVDQLLLLGHVEVISDKRYGFVFLLRADTPILVLDRFYEMSRIISQVYRLEEDRCQYLTEECLKKCSSICSPDNNHNSVYEAFLSSSNVGREMESIFKVLKSGSSKSVRINNLVPLQVSLGPVVDSMTETTVRVYHSLLLINPPNAIATDILPNSLPQMAHKFLQVVNPARNLEEIAQDADVHLDEVLALTRFFISQQRGKLIYPISRSNVYVLHPSCNMGSLGLAAEFNRRFSELNMRFSQLISKFSAARKVEDLLSFSEPILFRLIGWLLENDFIIQLHRYIFLMPPSIRSDVFCPDAKEDSRTLQNVSESSRFNYSHSESSFTSPTNIELTPAVGVPMRSNSTDTYSSVGDNQTDSLIEEVFGGKLLSWEEREEVEQTFRSSSEGSIQLLRKLAPYFDGTHHVEEILFNEMLSGVSEKDLEKLLIDFSNILTPYIRPETI
ncbi:Nitrogen permease regulator 3-like protein isoform X1 [Oopsacas minuta]|uniref:GATOR complex protein NPRL3 n=1 Tax=Oopsacas minuta TaxID=111878 RepID=A0AAV7K2K6_9METZ|nr:Nitrogen permease regulator 3-like protein isoform X1 [Oopsacas minuta]